MVLDDGSVTVFNEGDICVQRGTDHVWFPLLARALSIIHVPTTDFLCSGFQAWRNVSPEPCRMMFVLVPSVPIKNAATGQDFEPTPTGHLEDEDHIKAAQ
jgi:hypothetical protein